MGGKSARTWGVRYNFIQKNLYSKPYLGYLTFSKNVCGKNFQLALETGAVRYEVMDKVGSGYVNTGTGAAMNGLDWATIGFRYIFQLLFLILRKNAQILRFLFPGLKSIYTFWEADNLFRHTKAGAGMGKDIGNANRDSVFVKFFGIDKVTWGTKKPKNCLEKAKIAFIQNQKQVEDKDYRQCVANTYPRKN